MSSSNRLNSVIYVNYSPYENSGKTLDFLHESFRDVFLFSIGFYYLGKHQKTNKLSIFKNGKVQKEIYLYHMPVPNHLVFLLLPVRSLVNFLQVAWHSYLIRRKFGKIGVYFSVNAFTAWIGLILKRVSVVEKTVFWVWDYYPFIHKSKLVTIMRWIYWQFDKIATLSDRVVYLNHRLVNVRKKAGVIPKNAKYSIVPIGTYTVKVKRRRRNDDIKLGFIGVLKKSQGLDMIFDAAQLLAKEFPKLKLEIIGSGPDEDYFKARARLSPLTAKFYGWVEDRVFERVLSNCTIGIAPYVPDESNVSFYGDPGKVKRYISFGLPAIITDVFEFSKDLEKSGAGLVVDYYKPKELVVAVKKIMSQYAYYSANAVRLNKKFYYRDLYSEMFRFINK